MTLTNRIKQQLREVKQVKEEKLLNDGTDGQAYIEYTNEASWYIKHRLFGKPPIKWKQEEIVKLLNDGRKYRLIKRAQSLQKEPIPQEAESSESKEN